MSYGQVAMAESYTEETSYKVQPKKEKKPNFIKRWFINQIKTAAQEARDDQIYGNDVQIKQRTAGLRIDSSPNIDQPERAIQFTVYNANGGRVIETRRYDRRKDQSSSGLYVIRSEDDFGREIDKIITMETLKG